MFHWLEMDGDMWSCSQTLIIMIILCLLINEVIVCVDMLCYSHEIS